MAVLGSGGGSGAMTQGGGSAGVTARGGSAVYNQTLALPVVTSKVEPTLDYNWNGGAPVQGTSGGSWSGRWSGTVTPPTTGTYTFSLTSDDGSRLYVNGQKIIDQWQPQASTT